MHGMRIVWMLNLILLNPLASTKNYYFWDPSKPEGPPKKTGQMQYGKFLVSLDGQNVTKNKFWTAFKKNNDR